MMENYFYKFWILFMESKINLFILKGNFFLIKNKIIAEDVTHKKKEKSSSLKVSLTRQKPS